MAHIYPCIGILDHDLAALREPAVEYFYRLAGNQIDYFVLSWDGGGLRGPGTVRRRLTRQAAVAGLPETGLHWRHSHATTVRDPKIL